MRDSVSSSSYSVTTSDKLSYSHLNNTLYISRESEHNYVDKQFSSTSIPCYEAQLCSIKSLPDEFGDYEVLKSTTLSYMYNYDESSLFVASDGEVSIGQGWSYSQDAQTITSPSGIIYNGKTTSRIEGSVIYFDFDYTSAADGSQKIVMTLREPLFHYTNNYLM